MIISTLWQKSEKEKKRKKSVMQKIHFFESFRSEPVKQVSYRPRCSTVAAFVSVTRVALGPAALVTYTHAAIRNNHLSRTVRGDKTITCVSMLKD